MADATRRRFRDGAVLTQVRRDAEVPAGLPAYPAVVCAHLFPVLCAVIRLPLSFRLAPTLFPSGLKPSALAAARSSHRWVSNGPYPR
ncbi:hypothetical protein GDO81_007820 [Engystomops pustulosus]|uniref:Uncharacterized protein n=1 Tax=Engystomops pustulosus TaxID=76066 RepID=A0AAV7CBY5_ENGPU|nr:hypothetical protein GDO81_007820 [Engystomops pustulosus]